MDPVDAVSAPFGPRPELQGSPAAPILCLHRGFRGQEPLENLHAAIFGRIVERSSASGRARREAFEWTKRGRELPGLRPIFCWRILGENTSEDHCEDYSSDKQKMNSALAQLMLTSFCCRSGARCRMSSELACGVTFAFNTDRDALHCFS